MVSRASYTRGVKTLITAVIPTLNCADMLQTCLKSLREQRPLGPEIEILVVDAGSSDETLEIAKAFGAKIIDAPAQANNQEYQKGLGIQKAKGDLILLVDSDNALPDSDWLSRRTGLFEKHMEMVAVSPLRYKPVKGHSALNRYFALFGVNDPVAYYLNKRDRLSWAEDGWPLLGKARDCGEYFLVNFEPDKLPTVGANGFLVRKSVLDAVDVRPETFIDIDVNLDIVRSGRTLYGVVKDDIIHETAQSYWKFLFKRYSYLKKHNYERAGVRRWFLVGPGDGWKLAVFCFYSLTIVKPLWDSLRGWIRRHDPAWFLHPWVCLGILGAYGIGVIESKFRSPRRGRGKLPVDNK